MPQSTPEVPSRPCNKALATPEVYKAYRQGSYGFSPRAQLKQTPTDVAALVGELAKRTNDLAAPAIKLMPEIGDILGALEKSRDCQLARMSGSGATCFGIYTDRGAARKAASDILAAHPGWWVVQSYVPYPYSAPEN